jgi:hypothetical protein
MENLNGHVTGNGGYSQGETFGNSPFFDPTDEGELEIEPFGYYASSLLYCYPQSPPCP